ncbi:MAG: hypothetical protein HY586_07215 [Candidatus Omnitrophica bacterium]|nr:hypothetical protein [Candidatus Omnitrophota bacterium]
MSEPQDAASFDELGFEEQKKIFFKSPYADRGELLLQSQDPVHLANSISSEEMYLMTRAMDPDMRSEVLKYANLRQLFFISDLDCWKRDRISRRGFLEWLRALGEADLEKMAEWLAHADYEMIVAGLGKYVQVLKPEWEYAADELLGDKPYFTLDGLYYIQTTEENFETVKLTFEMLYQTARAEYINVLEGILSEMDYEMEEEAYRRRQIRLGERGFPDKESAIQIYRALSHEEFLRLPKKQIKTGAKEQGAPAPSYPVPASQERLFLDDVLLGLSEEASEGIDSVQEELIWLTNKAIACAGMDLASEETLRDAVRHVRHFVNIGLETESRADIQAARALIQERWLEFIFRRGFTRLLDVRTDAQKIIAAHWDRSQEAFLEFLGEPYEGAVRGLLKPRPMYYALTEQTGQIGNEEFRDFKTQKEVEEIQKFLRALGRALPLIPKPRKTLSENVRTLSNSIGTAFAQCTLGRTKPPGIWAALNKKDLEKFLNAAFQTRGKSRVLDPAKSAAFISCFLRHRKEKELEEFIHGILARVEDEFSRIPRASAVEARYIRTVNIK